ncbi:hypothetical protein JYK22_40100, partial [Nonomuraea sp. RK-328]|nr:hypothetical protein [Nonomuraea sp. RK-328]
MRSTPVYQVIDEAVRRPSPLSRERGLPILVFTGDPAAAARAAGTAAWFARRVPYARIDAGDFPDVAAIAERLAGAQGMLSTWVRGTLLPPPRFPLTLFALWAWSRRGAEIPGAGTPPNPVVKRLVFRQWMTEWRKERARTGRVRRAMADYVGRAMTTWIPASGLAAYGLQKLVDGLSLLVWGAGIAVALVGGLIHALLLIRGPSFYRWFRRAPYLRRGRDGARRGCSRSRTPRSATTRRRPWRSRSTRTGRRAARRTSATASTTTCGACASTAPRGR